MLNKIKRKYSTKDKLSVFEGYDQKHAIPLVSSGADPWVTYKDGWYYYCRVLDDWQIVVNKVKRFQDIGKHNHVVWQHPSKSPDVEVWAPELHYLQGKWYIYVTMGKFKNHRMYALEAKTDDPQGEYLLKSKLTDPTDNWAIDGTVLEHNDNLYFIWSGWRDEMYGVQHLYIATMSNPWTISSRRHLMASPEYDWEMHTKDKRAIVNEGPEVLKHNEKTFVIFSASHSVTNSYCLGQLTLVGDDPMKKGAWVKKNRPVFHRTKNVFGPGHASFIKGPDNSDWIIYHTAKYNNAGWDRQVEAQKFHWLADGSPYFGNPLPLIKGQFITTHKPTNHKLSLIYKQAT